MAKPHDAHVIEKRRHEGDRAGESVFYMVGPQRSVLEEADQDLLLWQARSSTREALAERDWRIGRFRPAIRAALRYREACADTRLLAGAVNEFREKLFRALDFLAPGERAELLEEGDHG